MASGTLRRRALIAAMVAAPGFAGAAQAPPPEAFQVLPHPTEPGARITPYLKYQLDRAWEQDGRTYIKTFKKVQFDGPAITWETAMILQMTELAAEMGELACCERGS